jgi:isopentenyl-diphosphate delta-isomerase
MSEHVILVDWKDRPVGTAEKLAAHRAGHLHRAFSVFVLDGDELLLQRRAEDKYHSGGLWTNACCSHPRPGEDVEAAAHRRLVEEMGFDCPLEPAGRILYHAQVGGGLVEHEYDHLFVGRWEGAPDPDPREVGDWRWVPMDEVRHRVTLAPHAFTYWFRAALRELVDGGWLPAGSRGHRVA